MRIIMVKCSEHSRLCVEGDNLPSSLYISSHFSKDINFTPRATASIPPVDVPQIRSKSSWICFPVPFSISLRILTVANPFIPPPSIASMRNPRLGTCLPLIARRRISFSPKQHIEVLLHRTPNPHRTLKNCCIYSPNIARARAAALDTRESGAAVSRKRSSRRLSEVTNARRFSKQKAKFPTANKANLWTYTRHTFF